MRVPLSIGAVGVLAAAMVLFCSGVLLQKYITGAPIKECFKICGAAGVAAFEINTSDSIVPTTEAFYCRCACEPDAGFRAFLLEKP